MRQLRKILVPVDFSPRSVSSLRYALRLAAHTGATVDILHCLDTDLDLPGMLAYRNCSPGHIASEINKRLRIIVDRQLNHFETQPTIGEVIVRIGTVRQLIRQTAEELESDLLVIGSGEATEGHHIWESTATAAIDYALCPVLVVPEVAHYKGWKHLCYAGSADQIDLEEIEQLVEQFSLAQPTVQCVHIRTKDAASQTNNFSALKDEYLQGQYDFNMTFHEQPDTTVESGLIRLSKGLEADCIVMPRPRRHGLASLLRHSYAREVARQSPTPLLVLPKEEEVPARKRARKAKTAQPTPNRTADAV